LLNCILARRDFPDKNFPWCHWHHKYELGCYPND
jgi:hypothetical protein